MPRAGVRLVGGGRRARAWWVGGTELERCRINGSVTDERSIDRPMGIFGRACAGQ